MSRVVIYDTTLRDGAQHEGISLSLEDKFKIARKLDELGLHYIEGGWPGANPKDSEFFRRARSELRLRHAKLAAFGSTRRAGVAAENDPILNELVLAGTPVVAVVGKSWVLHVTEVLRTTREENLRMIRDSVAYLKRHGLEVVYDAEHFFDGFRADPEYALATLRAAAEGGADWLVLCDTNGGSLPSDVRAIVARVVQEFRTPIGIHTHNDAELAVANTLVAVEAGATHVQGTINGYGERVGNANLCSVIPNLKLKLKIDCISDEQLAKLTEVSRFVAEVANVAHPSHLPYVGASAFAHKAGLHVNAVLKTAASFEHIPPALVGNRQRILVSELSGRSNILAKARQLGIDLSDNEAEARRLTEEIKRLEHQGFQFDAAEASFELLLRRSQPEYRAPFELLHFLVVVQRASDGVLMAEATVKVRVGDQVMHTAAEGNGPVHALDSALRKALRGFYPEVGRVQLTDYKVRVLDGETGTAARVRVLIESTDGERTWTTVGSSTNIIEASWLALADSLEYFLVHSRNGHRAGVQP